MRINLGITSTSSEHIAKWESNRGNRKPQEEISRNSTMTRRELICNLCEKVCKSAGGLGIHVKRMQGQARTSLQKMPRTFQNREHSEKPHQ